MQSSVSVSKPLALVVIGLIIGVSLGLGSGYAVFYPDMVKQRNKTVEERVNDVENGVTALDEKIMSVNRSISEIDEGLEGVLALTDVIDQISGRVSALENGQITLYNELNNFEDELSQLGDDLAQLEDDFTAIEGSWVEVNQDFSDLETAYNSVNSELEDIQGLVRENDGIRILKAYMANPPVSFEQKISVEIYKVLIDKEQNFEDWVILYGENTAKILLQQEVDAVAGGLVWNPTENIKVGGNSYQVKLESYFTMEFSPAKVTVNNMHLEIRATVNIESGAINTLQVSLVEIG